jgi:hypothetical protein
VTVALSADLFFRLLYDARYHEAGSIAVWISAAVWLRILSATLGTALLAVGDSRGLALSQLVRFAGTTASALGGFWIAGVYGFLGGLIVGALPGHGMLLYVLYRRGIVPIWQDLKYTSLAITIPLGGYIAIRSAANWRLSGEVLVCCAALSLVWFWAAFSVKRLLRLRQQPAVTTP